MSWLVRFQAQHTITAPDGVVLVESGELRPEGHPDVVASPGSFRPVAVQGEDTPAKPQKQPPVKDAPGD